MKQPSKMYQNDGKDKLLPRISLAVFDHFRTALVIWAALVIFGVMSYTTFLRREGFPSISIPFTVISGAYLVNDPGKVDREVAKPISDVLLRDSRVKSVQTQARAAFYSVVVQYQEGTDAESTATQLEQTIKQSAGLPKQASLQLQSPKFGFTERGDDAVITVYRDQAVDPSAAQPVAPATPPAATQPAPTPAAAGTGSGSAASKQTASTAATAAAAAAAAKQAAASAAADADTKALSKEGQKLADFLKQRHVEGVDTVSIVDPFVQGTDPATGKQMATQKLFDRYGERQDSVNNFYRSVSVGVMSAKDSDVIKLDAGLRKAVDDYNWQQATKGYKAVVSATYATDIKHQIGELQRALLEGLLAVLLVGSLVIAVRASIITVISMISVLAITAGTLYLLGYTLNTITLFALILCLGLVVDDTIIMVEAIDAQRQRLRDARQIIRTATRKVSRAMVAATLTAALSFSPLLFVSGILGSFIRAIPVTVITSLLVSLAVALIFIPLFARGLLLGKKQLGAGKVSEPAAKLESRIANFLAAPLLWAHYSRKRLVAVGLAAVLIGTSFVVAAVFLFQKVTFNIFPPSKDTNGVTLSIQFAPGTSVQQAAAVTDRADKLVADTLGNNFDSASYFSNANDQQASLTINIIPYEKRDIHSPELVTRLQKAFAGFQGAQVKAGQLDVGPPASSFTVRINADDRPKALRLAEDLRTYLADVQLKRTSGTTARLTDVTVSDPGTYSRADGKSYISVSAGFDADDTSTLVTLAQNAVKKQFDSQRIAAYGLPSDVIDFNLGQEQENQDSFKSLALAFPLLLTAIFVLLAIQFRSLLQPLLIFSALPFSLFGITLGLYLTDNAFSFFAALGFFALIGLSLKNTILLTDYANQLRREGEPAVDAAVGALRERFRPLIATSLTAVVSLVPLAVSSPFWEGLAVVLISGLLSSTLLVVTVFPYYYLGAEFMRLRTGRAPVVWWLILTVVVTALLAKLGAAPALIAAADLIILITVIVVTHRRRRQQYEPTVYRLRR